MCVYDVVAAAQQGSCFRNLGRRLQLSEEETSKVVAAMLPVLSSAVDAWISRRDGMVDFLNELGAAPIAEARTSSSFFSDNRHRDRGIALLRKWRDAGGLDASAVAARGAAIGIRPDVAAQLLPWLAVLFMSAVQLKAQRPLGFIARDMAGDGEAQNPFLYLASRLSGIEHATRRPAVRRMLGSLLGAERRPARQSGIS